MRQDEGGNYLLTEFAKENLSACALNFRYNALELIFEFNKEHGVLYRQTRSPRAVTVYTPEEEVPAAVKAFDDTQ